MPEVNASAPANPIPQPSRRKHSAGEVFGELTLIKYLGKSKGGMQALFLCSCGHDKELRLGNVTGVSTPTATRTCGDACHVDPRAAVVPTYFGWHVRLRKLFGRAKDHPCVVCGQVTPGNQWAFDAGAFDRITQWNGSARGRVYSLDPNNYQVKCRRHHQRFDRRLAELTPNGELSLPHIAFSMMRAAAEGDPVEPPAGQPVQTPRD